MRIAYFVHDLTDPAVERRVRMFKAGGAEVFLTGFHRGRLPEHVDGTAVHDLGRTADARFASRLMTTVGRCWNARGLRGRIEGADVVVARNLETMAVANSVLSRRTDIPLIYECLDIHRLMLSHGAAGTGLRAVEGYLAGRASALMTSSPAFVDHYFVPRSKVRLPTILVENKVFLGDRPAMDIPRKDLTSSGPWQIGWFGAIRCLKSFRILSAVTRRLDGRLNVVIRGRPAYSEFPDFDALVAAEPFIRFGGAYRNPDDLMAIYREVDFAWVIDFFEEGLNSEWLLPNRLYESGWAGTIPIVRSTTATGCWLAERNAGVRLSGDIADTLVEFFLTLDRTEIDRLAHDLAQIDHRDWVCTTEECRGLVEHLARIGPIGTGAPSAPWPNEP